MRVNKLSNDVYEIENFISDDELTKTLTLISQLSEKDWNREFSSPQYDFWYGKVFIPDINEFSNIIDRIYNLFDSEIRPVGINISRYKKGDRIDSHKDNYDKVYGEKGISYGIVIYWNDDYEGGELYYKDLGITYKPKAGSLVIHSGDIEHESLEVRGEKERFFSTIFIFKNNSNEVLLNKKIFKDLES